jgi:hypothetical protein
VFREQYPVNDPAPHSLPFPCPSLDWNHNSRRWNPGGRLCPTDVRTESMSKSRVTQRLPDNELPHQRYRPSRSDRIVTRNRMADEFSSHSRTRNMFSSPSSKSPGLSMMLNRALKSLIVSKFKTFVRRTHKREFKAKDRQIGRFP